MFKKMFLVLVFTILVSTDLVAYEIGQGSFGDIYTVLKAWFQGSLGYIIALIGTMAGLLFAILGEGKFGGGIGHTAFYIIVVSFVVGGAVGISQTMADLGRNEFAYEKEVE